MSSGTSLYKYKKRCKLKSCKLKWYDHQWSTWTMPTNQKEQKKKTRQEKSRKRYQLFCTTMAAQTVKWKWNETRERKSGFIHLPIFVCINSFKWQNKLWFDIQLEKSRIMDFSQKFDRQPLTATVEPENFLGIVQATNQSFNGIICLQ